MLSENCQMVNSFDSSRVSGGDDILSQQNSEGKHPQFRDGEINLGEADRPDFESFRIAVLWSVRANVCIHFIGDFSRDFRGLISIYKRCCPAFAEAASRRQV
jgi:hypothetical protein